MVEIRRHISYPPARRQTAADLRLVSMRDDHDAMLYAEANARKEGQLGWTGVELQGGRFDGTDPNSEIDGTEWLGDTNRPGFGDQMVREDPDVGASVNEWTERAVNADWTVRPGDTDDPRDRMIAEWVDRQLFDVCHTRWRDVVNNAVSPIYRGFALAEPVFKRDAKDRAYTMERLAEPGRRPVWRETDRFEEGHHVLRDLSPRRPASIQEWLQHPDGTFAGIQQEGIADDSGRSSSDITIPSDRLCLWTFGGDGAEWRGVPLYRPAYMLWKARKILVRMGVIMSERLGVGVPIGKQTLASYGDPAQAKRDWANVTDALKRYRGGTQAYMAVPYGFDVSILESSLPAAGHILELYKWLGVEIHIIGQTVHLVQGQTSVGTYGMREGQASDFRATLNPLLENIADVINRSVVRPLVDLNWADVRRYPTLTVGDQQTGSTKQDLEAYEIAVRSGMPTQPEDFEAFRDGNNWPAMTAETMAGFVGDPDAAAGVVGTPGGGDAKAQDTALNGAQVTAALDIVARVVSGDLTEDMAAAMLRRFFGLGDEDARAILSGASSLTPTAPKPQIQPGTEAGAQLAEGRGCDCGVVALAGFGGEASMPSAAVPPEMAIRLLAESRFDARSSRVTREDLVKRLSLRTAATVDKVVRAYTEKIAEALEMGDAKAIFKAPIPGQAALVRTLRAGYGEADELGRSEVKREMARMESDPDFVEELAAALREWADGDVIAFSDNPSGQTNAIDEATDPKSGKAKLDLAARTSAKKIVNQIDATVDDYLQQTPPAEWSAEGVQTRVAGVITPRTLAKPITQDVNTVYATGRATQGRLEGAALAVYTLQPEIGLNGPHEPCVECVDREQSAANPAIVGSANEQAIMAPNELCESTKSGVNTCWCAVVYVPTGEPLQVIEEGI
jgi:hypothetical protein